MTSIGKLESRLSSQRGAKRVHYSPVNNENEPYNGQQHVSLKAISPYFDRQVEFFMGRGKPIAKQTSSKQFTQQRASFTSFKDQSQKSLSRQDSAKGKTLCSTTIGVTSGGNRSKGSMNSSPNIHGGYLPLRAPRNGSSSQTKRSAVSPGEEQVRFKQAPVLTTHKSGSLSVLHQPPKGYLKNTVSYITKYLD